MKYTCDHCGEKFKLLQPYSKHMDKIHGVKNMKIKQCQNCSYQTPHGSNLLRHIKIHEKSHSCDYCGEQFDKLVGKQEHTRSKHGGTKAKDKALRKKLKLEQENPDIYVFIGA